MDNSKYVSVIYDEKIRPKTAYPNQLIHYLMKRYHIATNARILDSGCGRGDFSEAFMNEGCNVVGIDGRISDGKSSNLQFIGGIDLENDILPFEDNYFDVVFSKSVLEHIHKPENYLSEIKRVLKPGGKIICLVPDWHSQMYIFYDDFSHVQPYTSRGLLDTLSIFGYSNVECEVFYQLPCVWKFPHLKIVCRILQVFGGPVKTIAKNKFYRFSRELMLLAVGEKGNE